MSKYAYNPSTRELINTETPVDWMGFTDAAPPTFDSATASCFWRGDSWEVVAADDMRPRMPEARRAEIIAALEAIDAASIRPAREIAAALAAGKDAPKYALDKLSALEEEAATLRAELNELPPQQGQ